MNGKPNIEPEKSETKENILYVLIRLKCKKCKDFNDRGQIELLISPMGR